MCKLAPIKSKKVVAEVYSFWRWVGEISLLTAGKAIAFNLLRAGYLVDLVRKKGFKPQQIGRPFPWPKPKRWDTSSHFGHETTAPPQNHLKRVWIRRGLHTKFVIWAQDKVSVRWKGTHTPPPSPRTIPLLDPSLLFLSQKQFALHFAGWTDWFTKEGGQADTYNIGQTAL